MIHRIKHHVTRHTRLVKRHLHNAFIPHPGNDHRPHALRHKALTAYAIIIVVVKVVVSGLLIAYPGPSATANLTAGNIIELTNQARQANSLKSLKTNTKLTSGAQLKAADMLSKSYFAHISPTKVTPWYWFRQAGYNYSTAGENLAMDFVTAEGVTEAWLDSPGHRRNILNSKFIDTGVAVASGKLSGVSSTVVVQFFGATVPTKQQPKQVAKITPPKPATRTTTSTVAQTAPPPLPPVLSEVTEPPPVAPRITSPPAETVLATAQPWVGGESQEGITIELFRDGKLVGTTTSDTKGYFRLQPNEDLPDGIQEMVAVAVSGEQRSEPSPSVKLTIDTKPPSASLAQTVMLPSYVRSGAFTVSATLQGEDVAEARVRLGSTSASLPAGVSTFTVELTPTGGEAADRIELELKDPVGNVSVVPIGSLSFLDVDVVQPAPSGFLSTISKLLFFSRKFFITFWLFLSLALAINVLVRVRVQHRPTILYSLLLLYGLTIIMITT
ncbi:MAG: hypothetical protein HY567_01095 [Candidatus Kerfeldbacteria bacterium]|nr:hypothetical protein [Candidatus Kerfeldbacteria bacterium]